MIKIREHLMEFTFIFVCSFIIIFLITTSLFNHTVYEKINISYDFTLALDKEEHLYVKSNQHSIIYKEEMFTPENLKLINKDTKYKEISAGIDRFYTIDKEGNLFEYFVDANRTLTEKQISPGTKYKKVTAFHQVIAIDEGGHLWGYGSNAYGQVGDGTIDDKAAPVLIEDSTIFTHISAGNTHSLAIDQNGNIWAWGLRKYNMLDLKPTKITSSTKFTQVAAGDLHSIALDENGSVWSWGSNYSGQLGDGTRERHDFPQVISGLPTIKAISAEGANNLALDEKGQLWTWGGAGVDEGPEKDILTPHKVGGNFKVISASVDSVAIKQDGSLWTFGPFTNTAMPFIPFEVIMASILSILLSFFYYHFKDKEPYKRSSYYLLVIFNSIFLFFTYLFLRIQINVYLNINTVYLLLIYFFLLIIGVIYLAYKNKIINGWILIDLMLGLQMILFYEQIFYLVGFIVLSSLYFIFKKKRCIIRTLGIIISIILYITLPIKQNIYWDNTVSHAVEFIKWEPYPILFPLILVPLFLIFITTSFLQQLRNSE